MYDDMTSEEYRRMMEGDWSQGVSEHDVQNAIIEYLEYYRCLVTRVNSGTIVIKGKTKNRVFRGADKGTTDLIACIQGVYFGIEVKKPGERMDDEYQIEHRQRVIDAGGIHVVADCLADVECVLGVIDVIKSAGQPGYYENNTLNLVKDGAVTDKLILRKRP